MLLFNKRNKPIHIGEIYFNTSNVTIQLTVNPITCFIVTISIHLMLLFNFRKGELKNTSRHFNTSNVTIQLCSTSVPTVISRYFNTSNVTIQPDRSLSIRLRLPISIHLMLLFNAEPNCRYSSELLFQYI